MTHFRGESAVLAFGALSVVACSRPSNVAQTAPAPAAAVPASAAEPPQAVVVQTPVPNEPGLGGGRCPEGMVAVQGGTFKMGERGNTVSVASFCLDVNEVTVDRYAGCVKTGRCSTDHLNECITYFNYGVSGRGKHPVNCVDWNQSAAFCGASGARLPTEEEWEWAARGGARGTTYPWGNTPPSNQLCWEGDAGGVKANRLATCAVGSFPAGDSPLGIHDLAGNVWEWTATAQDPTTRVYRGGSWGVVDASFVRAAYRYAIAPTFRDNYVGFRCARNLT